MQLGTRDGIARSLVPIHSQVGMSRLIVRLSISISKDIHRRLITADQKIQGEIGGIIVLIRFEIERGEIRENIYR